MSILTRVDSLLLLLQDSNVLKTALVSAFPADENFGVWELPVRVHLIHD